MTAPGEPRRDGDRILFRLGIANLAAACVGGITSGIDLSLHLLERFLGADIAQNAERVLEHRRLDTAQVDATHTGNEAELDG